jgi:ABC-2 type transport system permease protein
MTTYFMGDTGVLTGRTLRHVTRSVDTIITTVITPVAMMLMFVYVFGGAINIGSGTYVNYMLPGILLMPSAAEKAQIQVAPVALLRNHHVASQWTINGR